MIPEFFFTGFHCDHTELVARVETTPQVAGHPNTVLADNGYACGDEVETLSGRGIEVLVAPGAAGRQRRYDFRPPKAVHGTQGRLAQGNEGQAGK